MKRCIAFIIFLVYPAIAAGRSPNISVDENASVKVCGNLILGAEEIWVSEGSTKVTLFTHGDFRSKPMSGGYQPGDLVEIGDSKANCKYYVVAILKNGPPERPGTILLSKQHLTAPQAICPKTRELMGKAVNLLKAGDVTWINSCAYQVDKMEGPSETTRKAYLKKLNSSFSKKSAIPGELINAPDSAIQNRTGSPKS